MTPPRKARVSEYDELIAFLNSIFRIRMDREYCHIYQPTKKDMGNNIVLVEDGHIVSCVGIFPMTLVCGDVRLSVGGIGGVSTDPQYRGRGLMTQLLNRSIRVMRERNNDISILWGDRRRYNLFGWENAGRLYSFTVDRRHVAAGKPECGGIRPLSLEGDDLRRIAPLYEEGALRVDRTPAQLRSVLSRYTYETWVWESAGGFAYMTIKGTGASRELIECGGDFAGLDALLRFLVDRYGLESLRGRIAFSRGAYVPFLIERSLEWEMRFVGMVKILNLRSTLEKFAGRIRERSRRRGLNGTLTLEMKDSGQAATLHFGRGVTVGSERMEPVLSLSDTEMVRLVFGMIPPSHSLPIPKSLVYLDALFPLDFYVPRLDWV